MAETGLMCEIILIILMCRHIAAVADDKGRGGVSILFVGAFVALYIGGEILGGLMGFFLTGLPSIMYACAFFGGITGGFVGYMLVLVWPAYSEPERPWARHDASNPRRRRTPGMSTSSAMVLVFTVLGGLALVFLFVIVIVGIWVIRRQLAAPPRQDVNPPMVLQPNIPENPPPIDRPPPEPWRPPVEPPKPQARPDLGPAIQAMRAGRFLKPEASPVPTTNLLVDSTPGDYIGQGKTYSYPNAKMMLMPDQTGCGLRVNVEGWSLAIRSSGKQPLNAGEYRNATRGIFGDQSPGLDFTGMGRGSNQVAGEFTIWQLEHDGVQITRLAIDFVHRSEKTGPPLYGVLRYNSTLR